MWGTFRAAEQLTLAVPEDSILPHLAFRPQRFFKLVQSATGSTRSQKYQTEPHLEIFIFATIQL